MASLSQDTILCHVDSLADNFLFVDGEDRPYILDWEYAGLCDPMFDIASFILYGDYSEEDANRVIAGYFPEGCDEHTRGCIYAYLAIGGLLWYDWCEYRQLYGAELSAYAATQFRFAEEYPTKAHALLGEQA